MTLQQLYFELIGGLAVAMLLMFLNYTTWPGSILDHIRISGRSLASRMEDAPAWIAMPLWECPMCMAPWHGLWVGYLIHGCFTWNMIIMIGAAGCCALILDTIIHAIRNT